MFVSRKMMMATIGLSLVTAGFVACGFLPLLAAQYTIFVGAVTGLVGLFCASNVSSQFVERKGVTEQNVAVSNAQAAAGQAITPPATPAPIPAPEQPSTPSEAPPRASADLPDDDK